MQSDSLMTKRVEYYVAEKKRKPFLTTAFSMKQGFLFWVA